MRMSWKRFARPVGVVAGILFLSATPELSRAQDSAPAPLPIPHRGSPAARLQKDVRPPDYFAGLKFTDDQKAKIDTVHRNTKARTDAVANAQKLSAEQKDAMLSGIRRMENGQIFKVLTPEQQQEVRERIRAQHAGEQGAKVKQQSPSS